MQIARPAVEFLGRVSEPAFSTSPSRNSRFVKVGGALFWAFIFPASWPPYVERLWFSDNPTNNPHFHLEKNSWCKLVLLQ